MADFRMASCTEMVPQAPRGSTSLCPCFPVKNPPSSVEVLLPCHSVVGQINFRVSKDLEAGSPPEIALAMEAPDAVKDEALANSPTRNT